MEGISNSFEAGGPWMYPILVVGLIVVGIVAERIYVLYVRTNSKREAFLSQMRSLIMSRNLDKAVQDRKSVV